MIAEAIVDLQIQTGFVMPPCKRRLTASCRTLTRKSFQRQRLKSQPRQTNTERWHLDSGVVKTFRRMLLLCSVSKSKLIQNHPAARSNPSQRGSTEGRIKSLSLCSLLPLRIGRSIPTRMRKF